MTRTSIRSFRSMLLPVLLALASLPLRAQSPDDGLMMPKRVLSTGVLYSRESWDQYWEGSLKRTNGNIGTLTTQSLTWVGGYGITERLSVMTSLPYVWTHTSQGTLHSLSGTQDLTFAVKYRLLTTESTEHGGFSAFVVGAAAIPMTNYTPDFPPLSIGTAGSRASARLTLNYQSSAAWFATASSAYTFCNNVRLDRVSYFTNGQLYMTNEVAMPNVLDSRVSVGYRRGRWRLPLSLVQQHTLGGGDIRRQDMPFVSNRMDFVKLDGTVIYAVNMPGDVSVRLGAAHVLSGRNVGQSTTLTSGVFYAIHF